MIHERFTKSTLMGMCYMTTSLTAKLPLVPNPLSGDESLYCRDDSNVGRRLGNVMS